MAEKTATRQAEGSGKPGQKNVTFNQNNTTTGAASQAFLSGFGGYYTANPTAKKPKDYITVTLDQIRAMAETHDSTAKDQAQWIIPSTTGGPEARGHAFQWENGIFWALWADLDDVDGLTFDDVVERIKRAL